MAGLKQLDLFDREPPYVRDSDTSKEAAKEIKPHLNALQSRVLWFLRSRPSGATDEEVQRALAMNPSTERPRRVELEAKGLVRDSGRRRRTSSGRQATVWEAIDAGSAGR